MDPLHQLLRWISGNPEGGVLATAAALAEPVLWVVHRVRQRRDSGVLDLLRASGGDTGVGFREDQIAGQSGSEPHKVGSALRRLEKKGKVRQSDGLWYVAGSARGRASK